MEEIVSIRKYYSQLSKFDKLCIYAYLNFVFRKNKKLIRRILYSGFAMRSF